MMFGIGDTHLRHFPSVVNRCLHENIDDIERYTSMISFVKKVMECVCAIVLPGNPDVLMNRLHINHNIRNTDIPTEAMMMSALSLPRRSIERRTILGCLLVIMNK